MGTDTKPQILILGGGYAGVATAVNMVRLGIDKTAGITLINESNFHYLTTLLHHAILEPVNEKAVSIYLPEFFKERINFIRGCVEHIEPFGKAVTIRIGQKTTELRYDYLIIALGWEPDYYNIQGLRENAFVLRNIESAHKIHDHIEEAFARYDKEPNQSWLIHILIGGASFTGIEIAAEVADLVPMLSKKYSIDQRLINIVMVGELLPEFDGVLASHAMEDLKQRGIDVREGVMIDYIEANGVVKFKNDSAMQEGLVIWAGGIKASDIPAKSGFQTNKKGRVVVNEFLQAAGHEDVYIIGDCAMAVDEQKVALPQTAQFAVQEGIWLARHISRMLKNRKLKPFIPHNRGMFLSVGRKHGLGVLYVGKYKIRFTGLAAKVLKKSAAYRYLWRIGGLGLVLKKIF